MSAIWNWIVSFFKGTFGAFLREVFTAVRIKAVEALKDIAVQIVTELQATDLLNSEKRAIAFDKIKAYAKSKGIEVADSVINLILEMAVAKIKG